MSTIDKESIEEFLDTLETLEEDETTNSIDVSDVVKDLFGYWNPLYYKGDDDGS